jgi:nucleotide-binding universal stress UspA family protein
VIQTAAQLAGPLSAKVYLLHVAPPEPEFVGYDPGPQSVRDTVAKSRHDEHRRLQELEKQMVDQGVQAAALLVQGFAVEKILSEAARLGADLVVMGSHGHGALRQILVGSATDGVLRKATCPVVIVPHVSGT